ncbi:MAG: RICIN domain-containing protein [Lachnospiraceae bacterium]|nr:RICIN domain-containing protein [Lachnospiraceae bacterium]
MKILRTKAAIAVIGLMILVFSVPAFGADLLPLASGKGKMVYTYPVKSGKITVYADENLSQKVEKIKGKKTYAAILKQSGSAVYAKYKYNGKLSEGWFKASVFLYKPSYKGKDACTRYKAKVIKTVKGKKSFGSISAFSRVQIVGEYKGYKQVVFKYGKKYRMGWVTSSEYERNIRLYDGSEKQIMAEGTYTLAPKSGKGKMVTADAGAVGLADAKKNAKQKFVFEYYKKDYFRIYSADSGHLLTYNDSGEGDPVIMAARSEDPDDYRQLWHMERYGAYYYLKNAAAGKYLYADDTFSLKPAGGNDHKRFRVVMADGKNKKHWRVFCQYEPEWGAKKYGRTNNMAASACAILSFTNTIYALNGQYINPMKTAAFSVKKGYRVEGSGTSYKVFAAASKEFGKTYGFEYLGATMSFTTLKKHLKAGETAIAYVPGHYMACVAYKNGKFLMLESAYGKKRGTTPYGDWVTESRLKSGTMKSKNFFVFKATD